MADGRTQASVVVAVDEARQVAHDVFLALDGHGTAPLDLQRLGEALHHGVVMGIALSRRIERLDTSRACTRGRATQAVAMV